MSIVKMCVKPRDQRLVADNLSVCSQSSQSSAESNSNDQYDQYKFPTHLFAGLEPEPVDFLPGDINGMQLFRLQATPKNCWKVASDLRYFKMNTSSRKHLTGKRKIGLCMGNTICNNDLCSYRKTCKDQSRNTLHWEFLDRKKICKHCGVWGSTAKCNARKLAEFDSVEQHVTVYHIGYHSCTPKADSARYDSLMTEALSENMSLGPTSVKRLKQPYKGLRWFK